MVLSKGIEDRVDQLRGNDAAPRHKACNLDMLFERPMTQISSHKPTEYSQFKDQAATSRLVHRRREQPRRQV